MEAQMHQLRSLDALGVKLGEVDLNQFLNISVQKPVVKGQNRCPHSISKNGDDGNVSSNAGTRVYSISGTAAEVCDEQMVLEKE